MTHGWLHRAYFLKLQYCIECLNVVVIFVFDIIGQALRDTNKALQLLFIGKVGYLFNRKSYWLVSAPFNTDPCLSCVCPFD